MLIQVDNYIIEIDENSVLVMPNNPRCRVKEPQRATFAEIYSLRPQYVRKAVARKLQYIGYVYLYHFDRPYPAGVRPQHYVGFAKNVQKRELQHLAGNGAKLLAAVSAAGISWKVAKVWVGDRHFERKIKRERHYHRHCIFCKQIALVERIANEDSSLT